ncbi:ATPase components of ABC transporters with duplicated ATPase domains [Rhizobiales bacterium GAS113]|nr:ATPase components of ABC transporters with duplicated ATPase domains [Rhizobiales bacterium GAS113]
MSSINLRQVSVFAPNPLFQDLSLTIGDNERLGLIAGNGAGKSTLLRCLAGLAEPTAGEIIRSRGLRLGFVEQDVASNLLDLPLAEAVRRALPSAEREASAWRVDVTLDEFDTPVELRDRPVRALSGGWQRLALIARAWVAEPDILLLDEPTNHLDLAKIELLESWINDPARRVPMVIASHDRRFLDSCTTRTLFLRPGISRIYGHPYTRARHLLDADDAAQAAKFAKDRSEADRLRRSANALRNIGINSRSDAAQKKSMQMAERAESLEQTLRPAHKERAGEIRLDARGTHARVLIAIDDVAIAAPDGQALFRTGKLSVLQGDRIVVLGRNGAGKSLFIGLLSRAMTQRDSVPGIQVHVSAVLGYVDQQMSQLPSLESPLGFISGRFRLGDQRSVSLLAGAGFGVEQQRQVIARLSPGQKARLGLLALRLTEPNLYLMDEPTNHVDIAGQEKLEAEILAHGATCVLASHDRSFVKTVATRCLLIEAGRMTEIELPREFEEASSGKSRR